MPDKLYHGTIKRYKNSILKNGLTLSDREDNYLGTGVYFYDDSQLAVKWARNKAAYHSDSPIVFESNILYDNVLDLTDNQVAKKFESFAAGLDTQFVVKRKGLRKRQLMALKATLYINAYCTKLGIDIVRGLVFCGERMFLYNSGIIYRTELQYCVRNVRSILSSFVAYSEENDYDAI